ncbi:MAG: serine/threonine-protein kinase [Pirellulaceae bacterium]
MIARFHYDEKMLSRLLRNELDDQSEEVQKHVETCELCQDQLEALSAGEMTWDDVCDLMRQDNGPHDDFADTETTMVSRTTFLEDSDDPNSLGRFGRYEILEILGRGGMGIVMRGIDSALDRHCAIKVLAPELASNAAARKRFSREARSAAAVVHPHVVPIQTVDQHDGLPYLVMPVVEGRSLAQRVQRTGPLDVVEVVRIAAQIADGLSAAHSQGLVHRDIKPANVLLDNGVERVQITDFGLARAVDDASMTRSGVIAGTPQYMSPEQAHGDTIDHRSDLFSLGSVMYFMLTGRSPFRAETSMGVLNRICNDQPRSLRSINADVPPWLEKIITRLLEKSPDDRFQSADELQSLLVSHLTRMNNPNSGDQTVAVNADSESEPHVAASARPPSRVHRALIAAGFVFAALAGVLIYLQTNKGTLRIESNSDVDVPIRIMSGDKTVEQLTVSKAGATTRLQAGRYVIEVADDDSQMEVKGDQFTLRRGEALIVSISPVAGLGDGRQKIKGPTDGAMPDEQLQGSWRAIPNNDDTVLIESLTFYRDRVGAMSSEGAIEGIVSLPDIDAKGAIDFRWPVPNKNPMPISRGLYEFRDGALWLRMSAEGKPRPKELTADQPGTTLVKYEREWARSDLPTFDPAKTLELQRWAGNREGAGVATTFNLFVPGRRSLLEFKGVHAPMAPAYELSDIVGFEDTTFTVQLFLPNLSPRGMEFLARNSIAMAAWPSEFMAAGESRRVVKAYYLPDSAEDLRASSIQFAMLTNTVSQTQWLRDLDGKGDVLGVYELALGHLPNIESQDHHGPSPATVSDDVQPSGSSPPADMNFDAYVLGTGKVVDLVPREQRQPAGSLDPDAPERAVELWISGHDVPLVQRGDQVRLLFEGWPSAEPNDLFAGKVTSIDSAANDQGKFRILVKADGTDSWPDKRYLRPGVSTTGWILARHRSNIESRSESGSPAVPASESDTSALTSLNEGSQSSEDNENRAASRVQIYFRQPRLVKLTFENDSDLSVVAPGRLKIESGKVYGLVLSNVVAQPNDPLRNDPSLGDRFDLLAGWMEVAPVNDEIESYLKNDDVLLDFSDDEIAEVQARGVLTKVIYLTRADDSKPRRLKILSQTLFEHGDGDAPIRKARLDGDILAVVRLGESVYYDNGYGARLRRKRILGLEENLPPFEEEARQLHNLRVGGKPTIEEGNAIVDRLLSRYPEHKATIHGQAAHLFGQSGIKEFGDEVLRHATESLRSEDDIVERSRMFMYLSNAHEVQGRPSEANYWALRGLLELQPFNLPQVAPELPVIGRFNDLVAQPGDGTDDGAKRKLYQRLSAAENQARDAAKQVRELVQFRDIYVDILLRLSKTEEARSQLQSLERERIGSSWLQEFVETLFILLNRRTTRLSQSSEIRRCGNRRMLRSPLRWRPSKITASSCRSVTPAGNTDASNLMSTLSKFQRSSSG